MGIGIARWEKKENSEASIPAKVGMRSHILEYVAPSRVFDGFCGHRTMYKAIWHKADFYIPCDESKWELGDPPRYVCDNRRLLRCLDLSRFNIFDFDAFGSPWDQVLLIAHRRKWATGEMGGLVITDGATLKTRWGELPHSMATLCGMDSAKVACTTSRSEPLRRLAISNFAKISGVEVKKQWEAVGPPPACVYYGAIVFDGL